MGTAFATANLRSLFTIRESEIVAIAPCENVPCVRIDVDYEALENDVDEGEGLLVRFGRDDLLYIVSGKALAGAHGKMVTLKVIVSTCQVQIYSWTCLIGLRLAGRKRLWYARLEHWRRE